ncbi:MAG: hypothetical protein CTY15_10170 [Methylocystis sp.]|nr:MAG: hypothetical protein CTY15_10170 [Methylocystis sp.]
MLIDEQGALEMRRAIYAKGKAAKIDLVRAIDSGRGADAYSDAFIDLLSEVAADVLVNDVEPARYIQAADAEWLVTRLNGGLANRAEYAMLTHVIGQAVSVPPALAAFVVGEIERGIVKGAAGHQAGVVTDADLQSLRTVVYAATEGSSLHVTQDSAEALFRIADALADGAENPGFDDFFAKAIGNYVMGLAFRWTPSASEKKRVDAWLDAPEPGFGAFLGSMLDFSRIGQDVDIDADQNAADARDMMRAEAIDAGEAEWLVSRLTRDGKISSAERRLLRFLKEESPAIAPALAALMEKAA